jgi:hypothetical protein
MKNTTTHLTALELAVLASMFQDASGNGHDFGIVENVRGIVAPRQLGAIVASLVKKDIVTVHDKTPNGWTQFTWNYAGDMDGTTPESIDPKSLEDVLPGKLSLELAA